MSELNIPITDKSDLLRGAKTMVGRFEKSGWRWRAARSRVLIFKHGQVRDFVLHESVVVAAGPCEGAMFCSLCWDAEVLDDGTLGKWKARYQMLNPRIFGTVGGSSSNKHIAMLLNIGAPPVGEEGQ